MTSTSTTTTVAPAIPATGRLRPLGLDAVRITGGFWNRLQTTNATATLGHIRSWLEREGWLPNFDLAAAGTLPQGRRGREFADSEVYKYLEAVAWEIGRSDDVGLEEQFRGVVARVAAAQEADGYLGTAFGRPGQSPRWSDLEWGHELYCIGHLLQAAVARIRTRPDAEDGLAEVARRAADLVCDTFGADGIRSVCGHAEIETALAEFARATGEPRYLEQARLFIDRRGTHVLAEPEWGRAYFQDDMPIREASVLRGHAVRANYLSSGAVDVAVDTHDPELLSALRTQWATTTARRTYLTGGQGSHHQDEAFGADWELPPDRAYSETCAGVASVQFSWRLLLATGDADYGDLIERTLYNVVATSPSADGRAFYYANTLHQREPGDVAATDKVSPRASSSLRAPWFDVACCPPNVARTLASLASYVATQDDDGVQLHQYAPSRIRTALSNGVEVSLDVDTRYPADGSIAITILDAAEFALCLRVPTWALGATLSVNGEAPFAAEPGTVTIRRAFLAGDVVYLELPVEARVTGADHRIDAVRGTVAIERGPVVYCLETPDLVAAGLGDELDCVRVAAADSLRDDQGRVTIDLVRVRGPVGGWPYGRADIDREDARADVELIPYHSWAERGPAQMRVWIPWN